METIDQQVQFGVVGWIAGQGGAVLHLPRQPFGVTAGQEGAGTGSHGPDLAWDRCRFSPWCGSSCSGGLELEGIPSTLGLGRCGGASCRQGRHQFSHRGSQASQILAQACQFLDEPLESGLGRCRFGAPLLHSTRGAG